MNNILNIGHTSFNMKNSEAMLAFYKDVMGMEDCYSLTMGDLMDFMMEREMPEERRQQILERKAAMGDRAG